MLLNSKTKTITFTALLLAVSSLLSRILGLFRDNLLANIFDKAQTDIYFAAFRIPDFIYGILITGGIVAAFLPVFAKSFKKGKEEAYELFKSVLFFFLIGLVFISLVLAIFTPQLIDLIAPGFSAEQKEVCSQLTRIMFLSPVLLGISAIFSGILHYFNLFFAYALAPILYNVGIIFGILFFAPNFGLKGLAFGVILGALLHLVIQIPPLISSQFLPKFSFRFRPGLKRIFFLMGPRIIGAAAYHLNLIVITAIASTLSTGAISVFNFSNNIQHVPIGLIGISFATAVFPLLSKTFAADKKEIFKRGFSLTFSKILFLIIPLSALIYLLRAQIIRFFLGTRIMGTGLDWTQTRLMAGCLGIFSLGLFAACLVPFLAKVFFSMHNTKTPVKIAVFSMALNVILCFVFVWLLGFPNVFQNVFVKFLKLENIKDIAVIGLVLGLTISSIFQFFLLVFKLRQRLSFHIPHLKEIIVSTLLMAVLTYACLYVFSLFVNIDTVIGIFIQLAGTTIISIVCYFVFSLSFKIKEAKDILRLIFK